MIAHNRHSTPCDIQKVLITGCSYSAQTTQSGWKEENLYKTYPMILKSLTGWQIDNRAIGGCSNREIFQRTIENCVAKHYDLCIVQWSSLHRLWLYEAIGNIDDFTQIYPVTCGHITKEDIPHALKKMMVSTYLNDYMALKHWLHDQISLQCFFEKKQIPFVFLRGFPNFVPELELLMEQWPKNTISELDIPEKIKRMLNFDSNPDDYLYQKLGTLISAYQNIDKSQCIGYNHSSMIYGLDPIFKKDYADDDRHPGHSVNCKISQIILEHIKQRYMG